MVKYVNMCRGCYTGIFSIILCFNEKIYFTVLQQLSSHAHEIKSGYKLHKQRIITERRTGKFGHLKQGRRELGGGPGQIFFKGPLFQLGPATLFSEKNFPDEYVVIAFQRLYLNFSYRISALCPQKTNISCPFRGNISPR